MPSTSQAGFRERHDTGARIDPRHEDHYDLLGVPFTATHAEITRAYRLAMKRSHPDRQRPDRRAEFDDLARRLNAAYTVLSDPLKRQAYDRSIRQQVIQDQIMQRYVGGFQPFGAEAAGPRFPRPEATPASRRERAAADRQASMTLVAYAVAVMAVIIALLLLGSLIASALDVMR